MSKIATNLCFEKSSKFWRTKTRFSLSRHWNWASCLKYCKKLIFFRSKYDFKFYRFRKNKTMIIALMKKIEHFEILSQSTSWTFWNDILKMTFFVEKINDIFFRICWKKNYWNKIMMIFMQNILIIIKFLIWWKKNIFELILTKTSNNMLSFTWRVEKSKQ